MTDEELIAIAEVGNAPCFYCGRRVPPTRTTDGCHPTCKFYKIYREVRDGSIKKNMDKYHPTNNAEYGRRIKNAGARARLKKKGGILPE